MRAMRNGKVRVFMNGELVAYLLKTITIHIASNPKCEDWLNSSKYRTISSCPQRRKPNKGES